LSGIAKKHLRFHRKKKNAAATSRISKRPSSKKNQVRKRKWNQPLVTWWHIHQKGPKAFSGGVSKKSWLREKIGGKGPRGQKREDHQW